MGLDSVELVMFVENEFGITIPDAECEKIDTVQEFADVVFKMISVNPTDKCLTQIVFYRIRKSLQNLGFTNIEIKPDAEISEFFTLSELKSSWDLLESELGLRLPELVAIDFDPNLSAYVKILGIRTIKRRAPVTKGTIRQLINWIISLNFEELIDVRKITDKYEVERVICGLISDKMGIPISEIELRYSITKDLGID